MSNNESWGEEHLRPLWEEESERRMEAVFQNGNDGEHYDIAHIKGPGVHKRDERLAKIPRGGWRDHFARHGGKLANTTDKC